MKEVRGVSYYLASAHHDPALVNVLNHLQTTSNYHFGWPDYMLVLVLFYENSVPSQMVTEQAWTIAV